MFLTGKFLRL